MSIKLWLGACALTASFAVSAEQARPMYAVSVTGEVQIGTDGAVRDYRLQSELAPTIAALVDKNVRSWTFKPILVDGKPVIAKTKMRLSLSATPIETDQYTLKVDNVTFGEPERTSTTTPPSYPMNAVQAHLGAKVILVAKLDAHGNVVDVLPEQTSLTAQGGGVVADRWRSAFEKASIRAVKNWKFNPTEQIDGKPVESIVRIPIVYAVSDRYPPKDDSHWLAFAPGPVHSIPWLTPKKHASQAERDALKDGQTEPLASLFQLNQDVVGKTL